MSDRTKRKACACAEPRDILPATAASRPTCVCGGEITALGEVAQVLPRAREMGTDGCTRMAAGYERRGLLREALLWHAAACVVGMEAGR